MKRYFFLMLLCLTTTVCSSQILNPSFEYWNGGNPNFWHTTNSPQFNYISPSDTAYDNMYGLRSQVVTSGGFHTISPLWSGNYSGSTFFFPCDCRPDALSFWYQLYPTGGEAIVAIITGKQNNIGIAGNSLNFGTPSSVYTQATLPIYYSAGGNVDSMSIMFSMAGSPGTSDYHAGAYYIIDDLSWVSATDIETTRALATTLEFISPNPTNGTADIVYTLSQSADVSLEIFDATGRLVRRVLREKQEAGRYKAIENFSDLAAGVYICRLVVDGSSYSKAFAVTR